ncbi:MAG: amidohydrolase, partial [Dinghuibacter sp.]|nr:amidohydrolase [Dinghuibacter sp.]
GETQVETAEAYMFGEDFAHYALQMPGCFYWLGVRNEEQGITSGLHSDTMNIDEQALVHGAGLMAWLAVNELAEY